MLVSASVSIPFKHNINNRVVKKKKKNKIEREEKDSKR